MRVYCVHDLGSKGDHSNFTYSTATRLQKYMNDDMGMSGRPEGTRGAEKLRRNPGAGSEGNRQGKRALDWGRVDANLHEAHEASVYIWNMRNRLRSG